LTGGTAIAVSSNDKPGAKIYGESNRGVTDNSAGVIGADLEIDIPGKTSMGVPDQTGRLEMVGSPNVALGL
jgi:hypothetical protein